MCAAVFADPSPPPRKAPREVRRHQLIEATIDALARKGYAELTLADVAKAAGLSVGIVNFHFESKEKLLVETLKALADDYRSNWQMALRQSGPRSADKLAALLAADFNERICSARTLAACVRSGPRRNAARLIRSTARPTMRNIPLSRSIYAPASSAKAAILTTPVSLPVPSTRCSKVCGST